MRSPRAFCHAALIFEPRAQPTDPRMTSPASLIDRAGFDRTRLTGILHHGLEGADDGELYLEYRQSEVMGFGIGRLKQATYDTAQGFGLRAVKDEAVIRKCSFEESEASPGSGRTTRARAAKFLSSTYSIILSRVRDDLPTSSWPCSSRPSTSLLRLTFLGVDARDKRGHDESWYYFVDRPSKIIGVWAQRPF
jgi:hypothetical protein